MDEKNFELDDDILQSKKDLMRENDKKETESEFKKIKEFRAEPLEKEEIEALFEEDENSDSGVDDPEIIDVDFEDEDEGEDDSEDLIPDSEIHPELKGIEKVYEQNTSISDEKFKPETQKEIPKFDLAEQILARQRMRISRKRVSPAKKDNQNKNSDSQEVSRQVYSRENPGFESDVGEDREQLIAKIVAEDIRNLVQGRFN